MDKYMIIDGHQDIAFSILHVTGKNFLKENRFDESILLNEPQLNQSDYIRLINSGVKVVFGVCFPYKLVNGEAYTDLEFGKIETIRQLDLYNELEKTSAGKIKIIKTKEDFNFVLNTVGVLGLVLLIEDAVGVDVNISNLKEYYDKGVRMIGITWNIDNQFGGGTNGDTGLSEEGKNLLIKMDELGIILDTAHMNKKVFKESLQIFKGKVMNSHTGVNAINFHKRNLDDDQLKEISDRGGVIGIAFVPDFLNADINKVGIDDVVAHIKHTVDTCGIDYVGFGSDFDGMSWPEYVPGLSNAGEYLNLIIKLEEIFTKDEISKIICTNWKRFLETSL